MEPITLTFEEERETKNTIRFQEIPDDDGTIVIGTLYIQKDALDEMDWAPGYNITVTIDVDKQ